jgi:hypothetical protein
VLLCRHLHPTKETNLILSPGACNSAGGEVSEEMPRCLTNGLTGEVGENEGGGALKLSFGAHCTFAHFCHVDQRICVVQSWCNKCGCGHAVVGDS